MVHQMDFFLGDIDVLMGFDVLIMGFVGRVLNGVPMPKPMRGRSRNGIWRLIGSGWHW